MFDATVYTRIYGQQQLGKCLCVAGSQPTLNIFCCKIIFVLKKTYIFFV